METETLRQFGFTAGLLLLTLLGVGYFLTKKVWPWATGWFEAAAKERREESAAFRQQTEDFRRTLDTHNKNSEQIVKTISDLGERQNSFNEQLIAKFAELNEKIGDQHSANTANTKRGKSSVRKRP